MAVVAHGAARGLFKLRCTDWLPHIVALFPCEVSCEDGSLTSLGMDCMAFLWRPGASTCVGLRKRAMSRVWRVVAIPLCFGDRLRWTCLRYAMGRLAAWALSNGQVFAPLVCVALGWLIPCTGGEHPRTETESGIVHRIVAPPDAWVHW